MVAMMTLSISYNSLSVLLEHDDHLGASTNASRAKLPGLISTHRLVSSAITSDSVRTKTLMEVTPGTHMYVTRVVKDFDSSLDPDSIARVRWFPIQKLRVSS